MTADCEANYLRLCRLLPDVVSLAEQARLEADSSSGKFATKVQSRELLVELPGDEVARLKLNIEEQCRYTTSLVLELAYTGCGLFSRFITDSAGEFAANLQVKMYHDLRLAEVVAVSGKRVGLASYSYPNNLMFQPDEKVQQNLFLAELLSQFVQHGLLVEKGWSHGLAGIG